MAEPKLERLICPKCGSGWLNEIAVKEMMFYPDRPLRQPIYGGGNRTRIYCGECGARVWPLMPVTTPKDKGGKASK